MKRPAVIAAILVLLLFNMPVYAASGYSGADDEVEEKVLVSAYGYSDSVDADNTSADNTSPSYDGSAAADQSDAVVYMFVSPERLPVQNGYPAVPESAVVQESGRRATPISIDEQTEADVREPATFMFLVDQSSSMKESGLKNAVELMESIRKHYALPEEPNYFFRGSEDGDIDSLVDSDTAFDSLTWRDDTDFYKSIDESLEKLSRMMRADSGSGWVPGSIASLVLLTDRDPEEIRAAETRIADYPEIVVHTVCFGQEAGAENDILFSGSTGVQAVIPEAGALYGRGASSAGSGIADFIDSLILYRFTVDTGMDSFSVRLSSNAGITNILENVKFLDSAASEDGPLAGGIPVLGQEPASADDSTDDPTDDPAVDPAEGTGEETEGGTQEDTVGGSPQTASAGDTSSLSDTEPVKDTSGGKLSGASTPETEPVIKNGENENNPSDGKDDSDGISIPLIAGIACGALVLLILLIGLLHRRDGDNDRGRRSGSDQPVQPDVPEIEDEFPSVVEERPTGSARDTERCARKTGWADSGQKTGSFSRSESSVRTEKAAGAEGKTAGAPVSSPQASSRETISIRIEEIEGNYVGKKTEFSVSRELLIGNDPAECDIVFVQEGISPRHSRIYRQGEELYIEDLGSEGGTYLGGMRLFASNRLRSGDEIGIGFAGFTVRFI